MKEFYLIMKAKVEGGQYTLGEMKKDILNAYGKGHLTYEQYVELTDLAILRVDKTYTGNQNPTEYDITQDILLVGHDLSIIELFEMFVGGLAVTMTLEEPEAKAQDTRSSISDSYVRVIIAGKRTFSSVPDVMKQEVADKLIALGREDLIDDPAYLPPTPPVEPPVTEEPIQP